MSRRKGKKSMARDKRAGKKEKTTTRIPCELEESKRPYKVMDKAECPALGMAIWPIKTRPVQSGWLSPPWGRLTVKYAR